MAAKWTKKICCSRRKISDYGAPQFLPQSDLWLLANFDILMIFADFWPLSPPEILFMSEFVHLHCHTEYSLLDGAIRLNDLCARAVDFGMPAAAITDHGNLYGAAYFYTTCKSYGIKPIIGCEVYVSHDHRDKESELARVRPSSHFAGQEQ